MPTLYTIAEAATVLGVSRRQVQCLINAKPAPQLGCYRDGKPGREWVRIGQQHIDEFLEARERPRGVDPEKPAAPPAKRPRRTFLHLAELNVA